MRHSYLEAFFRHRVLLVMPILLACALAVAFAVTRPRQYVATAAVWADVPVSEQSTIGTTGGQSPPAAGQQALLTQLLATRSFSLAVAREAALPGFEADRPPADIDHALADLVATISTATPGPNVLQLSAKQDSAQRATAVTGALLDRFLAEERAALRQRGETQIRYAQSQVDIATQALTKAQRELADYLKSAGPAGAGGTQADTLRTNASRARDALQTAQDDQRRTVATASLSVDDTVLSVLDRPTQATRTSRMVALITAAAGGALAGATLSVLALILLVVRDPTARREADVEAALGLPVAATISRLPAQSRAARRAQRQARAGEGR